MGFRRHYYLAALALALLLTGRAFADSDLFNRADSTDLGSVWVPYPGRQPAWIVNNAVQSSNLTSGIEEVYLAGSATDLTSQVTILNFTGAGLGDAGVLVRASATERTYYACLAYKNYSSTITIEERVNGSAQILNSDTGPTWTNGDIITIGVSGQDITCYQNGTSILTAQSATLSNGYAGIRLREDGVIGNNRIDDFFTSISTGGAANTMVIVVE